MQDEIVEGGKAATARRQGAVAEIRDCVHAFAVSGGLDSERRDELVVMAQSTPGQLEAELAQVIDELATRERHARKASREAIESHQQLSDMVGDARLRRQRRERLLELQREDESLGARAVEFDQLRLAVARARQARPVAGAMRTLASSEAALKRAELAVGAARTRVEATQRDLSVAELRVAAASTREVVGALTTTVEIEGSLSVRQLQLEQARSSANRASSRLERVTADLDALPEAIASQEQGLTAARHLQSLLDARTAAAERAQRHLDAAVKEAAVAGQVPVAEAHATQALEALKRAEGALAHLRQARIDDIAGELGLALVDGQPCPVCGSVEHPPPARPTPDAVTPQQVTDAESRVETLRSTAATAAEALAGLRAEIRELAAVADGLDVAAARAAAERAARSWPSRSPPGTTPSGVRPGSTRFAPGRLS